MTHGRPTQRGTRHRTTHNHSRRHTHTNAAPQSTSCMTVSLKDTDRVQLDPPPAVEHANTPIPTAGNLGAQHVTCGPVVLGWRWCGSMRGPFGWRGRQLRIRRRQRFGAPPRRCRPCGWRGSCAYPMRRQAILVYRRAAEAPSFSLTMAPHSDLNAKAGKPCRSRRRVEHSQRVLPALLDDVDSFFVVE